MAGESMRGRTTYERSGGDRPRGMIKRTSTWRVGKRRKQRGRRGGITPFVRLRLPPSKKEAGGERRAWMGRGGRCAVRPVVQTGRGQVVVKRFLAALGMTEREYMASESV